MERWKKGKCARFPVGRVPWGEHSYQQEGKGLGDREEGKKAVADGLPSASLLPCWMCGLSSPTRAIMHRLRLTRQLGWPWAGDDVYQVKGESTGGEEGTGEGKESSVAIYSHYHHAVTCCLRPACRLRSHVAVCVLMPVHRFQARPARGHAGIVWRVIGWVPQRNLTLQQKSTCPRLKCRGRPSGKRTRAAAHLQPLELIRPLRRGRRGTDIHPSQAAPPSWVVRVTLEAGSSALDILSHPARPREKETANLLATQDRRHNQNARGQPERVGRDGTTRCESAGVELVDDEKINQCCRYQIQTTAGYWT